MATKVWRGDAPAVADVWTFTPGALGSPPTSNTFNVTCNGKTVSYVCTSGDTIATLCTNLAAILEASVIPEFMEYTYVATSTTIVATANTAGIPGTFTTTASNGGGSGSPTFTHATTVQASGPNFWDLAANYVGGVAVATGDTLLITGSSSLLYCNQNTLPSIVTPAAIQTDPTWSGNIGLPTINTTNTNGTPYNEYRPLRVQFCQSSDSTNTQVSINSPQSGRMRFDFHTGQVSLDVLATGNSPDNGLPCLRWIGTATTNTMNVSSGTVGVAVEAGETANIGAIELSPVTPNSNTDPQVSLGSGVTLTASTTITVIGGNLTVNGVALHSLTQLGGVATVYGSAGLNGTMTLDGGTTYYCTSGTAATTVIGENGTLDCSHDSRARTFTNVTVTAGATINDPASSITVTNGIVLSACGLEDVTLKLGKGLTIAP